MISQNKMGFWTVTSLVAGSQIGTGIFLLPASMATFGSLGLFSWLITGTGAILLALIFGKLSANIPKTGGPHTFIEKAFGHRMGFFAAWTYWIISWLSTPMVVISVVSYLSPILGDLSPMQNLLLEIFVLSAITALNLLGLRSAGYLEVIFTLLKILPLIVVPIAGLLYFNTAHFIPSESASQSVLATLNAGALLTLWGFIGVESATTPAASVKNPEKTIPRALIVGTLLVASIYIFSSTIIMGVLPPDVLAHSKAPFADAAQIIFGGNWHLLISLAASIVCLGTLNAWVLTSGQIALGGAEDGHLPERFRKRNAHGSPYWGLIISSCGMIPIFIATLNDSLIEQVNFIIEISVTAFLFIYSLSVLSYLKLFWWDSTDRLNFRGKVIGVLAFIFCGWTLYSSGLQMVALASLIPITGLPLYYWKRRKLVEDISANPASIF